MLKVILDITQADIDAAVAMRRDNNADYHCGYNCPAARSLQRSLDQAGVAYHRAGCGTSVGDVQLPDREQHLESERSAELKRFTSAFDGSNPLYSDGGPLPEPTTIELVFPGLGS